jgi:hypothetical protein
MNRTVFVVLLSQGISPGIKSVFLLDPDKEVSQHFPPEKVKQFTKRFVVLRFWMID